MISKHLLTLTSKLGVQNKTTFLLQQGELELLLVESSAIVQCMQL